MQFQQRYTRDMYNNMTVLVTEEKHQMLLFFNMA
jgi:hypothetical protein